MVVVPLALKAMGWPLTGVAAGPQPHSHTNTDVTQPHKLHTRLTRKHTPGVTLRLEKVPFALFVSQLEMTAAGGGERGPTGTGRDSKAAGTATKAEGSQRGRAPHADLKLALGRHGRVWGDRAGRGTTAGAGDNAPHARKHAIQHGRRADGRPSPPSTRHDGHAHRHSMTLTLRRDGDGKDAHSEGEGGGAHLGQGVWGWDWPKMPAAAQAS